MRSASITVLVASSRARNRARQRLLRTAPLRRSGATVSGAAREAPHRRRSPGRPREQPRVMRTGWPGRGSAVRRSRTERYVDRIRSHQAVIARPSGGVAPRLRRTYIRASAAVSRRPIDRHGKRHERAGLRLEKIVAPAGSQNPTGRRFASRRRIGSAYLPAPSCEASCSAIEAVLPDDATRLRASDRALAATPRPGCLPIALVCVHALIIGSRVSGRRFRRNRRRPSTRQPQPSRGRPSGTSRRYTVHRHAVISSPLYGSRTQFLDVSVSLAAGIPAYPGNPEFELQPVKRIAAGGSSNVSKLVMGTHTGTHVDAPRHFFDDGAGVDALPLDLLLGRARVVEMTKRGGIRQGRTRRGRPARRHPRAAARPPTPRSGTARDFTRTTPISPRDGATLSRRPGRQGRRHRLPLGRAVQEGRCTGAPRAAGSGVVIIEGLNLAEAEPACTRCTACRCASRAATARRPASS